MEENQWYNNACLLGTKWGFPPCRIKIALNAVRLPKFEPVIVVAEKDHGKRFTAMFRAGVILRMRRELRGL